MQLLSQAPLFLTLAQVRFNTLPKLADSVADIQEAVRCEFPDQGDVQHYEVQPAPIPNQEPTVAKHVIYRFGNIERTNRFELTASSLTLISTNYEGYETFMPMFMKFLKVVHQRVQLQMVQRLGLRYCDRVMPRQGEDLNQYVVPEALGVSKQLRANLGHSYTESHLKKNDINLVSRVLVNRGPLSVPPGVDWQGLEFLERFTSHHGFSALLDHDGFLDLHEAFDVGDVEAKFKNIHQVIGDAFKLITTEHAHATWR